MKNYIILSCGLMFVETGAARAEVLLKVIKSETACTSENSCAYTNLTYRMDCSFLSDGRVSISKSQILGMVGPALPIPSLDGNLKASDLQQLNDLKKNLLASSASASADTHGRTYELSGVKFASDDIYSLPTPGGSDARQTVAVFFMQYGKILPAPEADTLVQLADRYCGWDSLRLSGN